MKLVVLDGPLRGLSQKIDKSPTIIGRRSDADFTLTNDPLISRFHCQITEAEGAYWLEDLGSGNGTFLGGSKVAFRTVVPKHRLIRIGTTHVVLLEDNEDAGGLVTDHESKSKVPEAPVVDKGRVSWTRSHSGELDVSNVRVVAGEAEKPVEVADSIDPSSALRLPENVDELAYQRLLTRLTVYENVSSAVAGKVDLEEIFEATLESIMEVVKAERGYVLEVQEDAKTLRAVASKHVSQKLKNKGALTLSRTIVGRVLREKMALLINDAMTDDQLSGAASILSSNTRSAICVPLLHDGKVAALVYLDTQAVRAFTNADLELVTAAANQAALAVANSKLYNELRGAYEQLENAHDQMVQGEKLGMVGTLAASIAHDIGNVITPISGVAKLVMKQQDLDPKLKAAFGRQMQRLKALTQQLLSFSRPKPPELQPTDLNQLVNDSLNLITTEARHAGVTIVRELAEPAPKVNADGDRIDQVLINLSINAIHAMGQGGQGGTLTLSSGIDGDNATLTIHDTGCGIPAERLRTIFEPFFTTKGNKGTGMGLFSCKRIIEEEHGGTLTVVSELDKGSTFTARIPLARP